MAVSSVAGEPVAQVLDLTGGSSRELAEVERRLHVVNALLDALDRIQDVNKVIEFSADRRSAVAALREDPFRYSREEADAILGMPMSWQCVETGARLRQERDSLAARYAAARQHVGEMVALHWFG